MSTPQSTREYVQEIRDDLVYILRAVAAALLTRGGEKPDIEQVKMELDLAEEILN